MTGTMTRREQAEAYADLYEVPIADVYRRYAPVLLPDRRTGERRTSLSEAGRPAGDRVA